jgi:hypothetical protein
MNTFQKILNDSFIEEYLGDYNEEKSQITLYGVETFKVDFVASVLKQYTTKFKVVKLDTFEKRCNVKILDIDI